MGAGGAGVTITLLTVGSGTNPYRTGRSAGFPWSLPCCPVRLGHFREHEIILKTGAIIGLGGIIGAFVGANTSNIMPAESPELYDRPYDLIECHHTIHQALSRRMADPAYAGTSDPADRPQTLDLWHPCGIINGSLRRLRHWRGRLHPDFLMVIFGVPLLKSIGTCMMIILPIRCAGGLGYLFNGRLTCPSSSRRSLVS